MKNTGTPQRIRYRKSIELIEIPTNDLGNERNNTKTNKYKEYMYTYFVSYIFCNYIMFARVLFV